MFLFSSLMRSQVEAALLVWVSLEVCAGHFAELVSLKGRLYQSYWLWLGLKAEEIRKQRLPKKTNTNLSRLDLVNLTMLLATLGSPFLSNTSLGYLRLSDCILQWILIHGGESWPHQTLLSRILLVKHPLVQIWSLLQPSFGFQQWARMPLRAT